MDKSNPVENINQNNNENLNKENKEEYQKEKTRKLNNLLYFDKENLKEIKNDFLNELEKINLLHLEQKEKKNLAESKNTNSNQNLHANQIYNSHEKIVKFLTLPNSKYSFISENLAKGYSFLQNSKNFKNIKRVFLLAHPFKSRSNKIYLSAYDHYESLFGKKFQIDKEIYEELKEDKQNIIPNAINNYIFNTFQVTNFQEDSTNRGNIIENVQTIIESEEDYDFSFDLHLNYLSLLYPQENIKIVPIWFKSNLKEGPKDKIVNYLFNFLTKYLSSDDNENLLINCTNLTYFGRNYNFLGNDPEFKKDRKFLKNKANEERVIIHVKKLDDEAINFVKNFDERNLTKLKNMNFCKDLFLVIVKLSSLLKFNILSSSHLCLKFDSVDTMEYDLNFCTLSNFYGYVHSEE